VPGDARRACRESAGGGLTAATLVALKAAGWAALDSAGAFIRAHVAVG
jgi:hypothetical protein